MDALNLLTHPRPRLPLSASQHSVSASDPHQPHVDNSSTPSLPEHGRTTPHRPDSQSLIPVRPLSQMSTRARRHSQSQSKDQRRSRRLSQSRSPSQQDLHPTADPNAQALPSRPASQLSKSTGHTRRPSFQDAPSRPVSQLSAYISSSHSRPVSRTLAAVPGTPTAARPLAPASPALEVGHLLPLSFSFAPNPKTPDHPHPAPPESEGTFGSASGRRAQIAKQQQHELRRSAGAGQRPAPAPPAAVAAPSAPLTTAVAPTPTPRTVKLAPVKTPNTNANGNAAPAPVPMPLPRPARWEPGAGALIRSAVLSQVPDAYRWSGEEFGEYIRLEEEVRPFFGSGFGFGCFLLGFKLAMLVSTSGREGTVLYAVLLCAAGWNNQVNADARSTARVRQLGQRMVPPPAEARHQLAFLPPRPEPR
ncbi:hypothetical protein CALCODRAFT_501410 [Calocera cornea HHB12733]|uniref:Uncharacterized protein n=1 Tax=Calocera cornea HHB12733 TaxID=1353952 RepID=A0A165DMF0_9BASI|nr:hypothetical protein CALCODRAFT_501410 [Calocera cornea HHB12733]